MAIHAPVSLGTLDQASADPHFFTIPAGGVPIGALVVIRLLDDSTAGGISGVQDALFPFNAYFVGNTSSAAVSANIFYRVVTHALNAGDQIEIDGSFVTTPGDSPFRLAGHFSYFTADEGWVATPSTIDASNQAINGSSASWTSGAVGTAQAQEVLVSVCSGSPSTSSSSPTGSFTEEQDFAAANIGRRFVSEYQIVTSLGTYTAGGTWSANASSNATIAAFKTLPATFVASKNLAALQAVNRSAVF